MDGWSDFRCGWGWGLQGRKGFDIWNESVCFVDVYTICNRKYILGARSIVRPHSDDKCESDTCAKQKKEQVEIRPPPHRAVCVCLCVCVLCASRTSTLHLSLKRYVQKMLSKFTTVTRKSDNDVVHLRVQHEFGSLLQ